MNCDGCKKEIIRSERRTSNGMGFYCTECIQNCLICENPVDSFEQTRCNNCWEVIQRIDKFLSSKGGKDVIWSKLVDLGVI